MEFIIAGLGTLTTIIGIVVGWLTGRKKTNAEVALLGVEQVNSVKEFYLSVQRDLQTKLDYYILLSENNREQIHILRQLVDKLIDDACLVKGCSKRIYYSEDEMKKILDQNNTVKEIEYQ